MQIVQPSRSAAVTLTCQADPLAALALDRQLHRGLPSALQRVTTGVVFKHNHAADVGGLASHGTYMLFDIVDKQARGVAAMQA